jgi:TolB-like protein/DNA-binding winged helix-turn-helix (wHTH) protein/Flp pilus assembly protein TadD
LSAVSKQEEPIYEFGPFRLEAAERLLLCGGQVVSLPPKVFDTLVALVENSPRLVAKDELLARLWPDTYVEEGTITRNISDLRKALAEASGGEQYIETVPRHGYRFAKSVKRSTEGAPTLIVEKHTRSRVVTQQEVISEDGDGREGRQQPLKPGGEITRPTHRLLRPRALISFTLLVALAVALFYLGISRRPPIKAPPSVRSIAVLPFKYIGGEEADRYIEIGMADALITRLSKISQIKVRPTNSITKYNRPQQEALAAGRELMVDSVLDGHIQRLGDRIRVSVQLISVEDGSTLWADQFDSKWMDIFAAQDSISERIIQTLALELSGEEEKRLAKRYTENVEAYQSYMKGRFWWNKRTGEGFERAIEFFNEAISLDRNYALPYAGLADCYAIMSPYNLTGPKESYPKAKAAATQALAIDNQLAEAHASLANITWLYEWDFPAAESEFRQAIELDANYPTAHQWYSVYLSSMGRHDEAIREAKQAYELDALSLAVIRDLARAYYHARQYDQAIATYMKALELDPRHYRYNSWLELAYAQKGLYDQAIDVHLKALNVMGWNPKEIAALELAYRAAGWQEFWRKELELAKERADRAYFMSYNLARTYARLGEIDQALEWLEKAYAEHSDHLVLLKVDPIFDPLRAEPRFTDLLRQVGLAPQ